MRETNDGFRIAEEDLRLRGPGEILGTRQSGEEAFRAATPEAGRGARAGRAKRCACCCSTATAGWKARAGRRRGSAFTCSSATRRWDLIRSG